MIQRREFERLLRENANITREQAALRAQIAANQQLPATTPPPAAAAQMPATPSAPATDLAPAQEAADPGGAADAPAPELPHAKKSHVLLLFVGLAAAAGVGGYIFLKKRKKS